MTDKELRSGKTPAAQEQAEETLRESERRYRLLFDNMTTAFALHEMLYDEQGNPVDYRFLDANKAFEQLTGLSVASILGRTVLEVLPGTERHWIETYAKVVQTGTSVLFEEYSAALGKWFETRAFRIAGKQFATVFADVSERKRLETEIQDAREYVMNIAETVREPLLVLSSDLKILIANHGFYDAFRGTPQATVGTFIYDLGNGQWDIPELRVLLENILPSETVFNGYEVEHDFPDIGRKTMVLNARQIYRKEIGSHLILLAIEDITERKQVEEKLSASEALYRRLFEAAKDGILILEADTGMIVDVNAFLTEMLGFSREEFLGKHIWDLGFFRGIVTNEADFLKLQQMEYIRYEDVSLDTADGRRINVEFVSNLYQVGHVKVIQCSIRRAHLASFPAQNPYPVVEVGTDGAVRFANPAAMTMLARLGLDPDARQFLQGTPEELVLLRSQCERNPQTQELHLGAETFLRVVTAPPSGDSLHVYAVGITERKRAEEQLHETSNYLDNLLNYANAPIIVWDAAYHITLFNHAFEHLTGRSAPDVLGKEVDLLFPPDKREESLGNIYRASSGKRWETVEIDIQHLDGSVRTLLWNSASLYAPDETTVLATIAQGQDVTDRKQAEKTSLESKELLSQTEKTAHIGGWMFDAEEMTQKWTEETFRILEIDVSEGEPKVPEGLDFIAPASRPLAERAVRRSIEFGEPYDQEWEIITAKGNRKWVHAVAKAYQEQGKTKRVSGTFQDITDRRRAEETLRESEERYRTLIQNVGEGIGLVDPEEQFAFANAAAEDIFGVPPGGLLGRSLREFTSPEQFGMIREQSDRRRAGEKSVYEIEISRPEGEKRNVLVTAAPQSDSQGKFLGAFGVFRDITDRKRAEAQLRQSQKMGAIGTLAGGVAHDFNNLLTGILGNIALMRSSLPPADPLLENLNAAETAARQAADLTKGLLTFSRSAVVLPVPMNLTAALDASLALLKQSLPATVEIVRDDEQTAWNVLLDQSQLTQILLNLAVNARDAMEGKGMLTIRARNEVVGEEYLQTHPFARTGEFVHLSVTDTGPGMSSEVMQHLFEPFYTTKPIGSGTGLGLSVVYGAVKQAGGWITAVSTEGVGTTFDMYLPRCLEEPTQSFTPSPPSVDVRGETVLVVEDEPIVCAVAQTLLSRSGYTVLTAPDGASALNALREHPTDIRLILLDMTMPGMTTGEIVQAIRALNPTVPILLNSGYTSNGAVEHMLEEDSVQGFLGKPYDLPQLLEKVQELLGRD